MNALLELRKQMEVDFLKTKTYEEINDMFNQLNDKLKLAESEVKKFRLGAVSGQSEQLVNFLLYLNDKELINNHDFDYEKEAKKYLKKKITNCH